MKLDLKYSTKVIKRWLWFLMLPPHLIWRKPPEQENTGLGTTTKGFLLLQVSMQGLKQEQCHAPWLWYFHTAHGLCSPSSCEPNMNLWLMCDGACSLLIVRSDIPDTLTERSLQERWEVWTSRYWEKVSGYFWLSWSPSSSWNTLRSNQDTLWGATSWFSRQNADKLGCLGSELMSLGTPAT